MNNINNTYGMKNTGWSVITHIKGSPCIIQSPKSQTSYLYVSDSYSNMFFFIKESSSGKIFPRSIKSIRLHDVTDKHRYYTPGYPLVSLCFSVLFPLSESNSSPQGPLLQSPMWSCSKLKSYHKSSEVCLCAACSEVHTCLVLCKEQRAACLAMSCCFFHS